MLNFTLKQKILALLIAVGTLLVIVFQQGFYSRVSQNPPVETQTQNIQEISVVSTNPSPLEGATIHATQTIEITFNQPVENVPELKWTVEPAAGFDVKLSDDRKTVTFFPKQPLQLGQGFTLFIKSDTKFDRKKILGKELIYHFSTINYRGV